MCYTLPVLLCTNLCFGIQHGQVDGGRVGEGPAKALQGLKAEGRIEFNVLGQSERVLHTVTRHHSLGGAYCKVGTHLPVSGRGSLGEGYV